MDDNDRKDDAEQTASDDAAAREAAVKREDERTANAGDRVQQSLDRQQELREVGTDKADIAPAKAKDIEASGAIVEPQHLASIDVDHPAVDNNPRENTSERQNQIDFNDPTLNDRQSVEQKLKDQS